MAITLKRIANAWRRHGPWRFVRLALYNVALWPRGRARDAEPSSFDALPGIETSGIREVGSLDIESANARHAFRYQPSTEGLVRRAIATLAIDPPGFSFIDFGSGKGRVLLVAADYPFKQVIGIELSQEMHEIALRNIACLPAHLNKAGLISCVCGNAAEFMLPESDLIGYFYNPFGPAVLGPIAEAAALVDIGRLLGLSVRLFWGR
ncbi:MAG: class I SAM-dependent methyltransferase [Stellaceae bacterium]